MHLQRGAGLPAVKVVDVVDIARAAGRVVMDVYKTSPEVSHQNALSTCSDELTSTAVAVWGETGSRSLPLVALL